DVVAKRIGARLDRPEPVLTVLVGDGPATTTEIWVDRRDVTVVLVPVASAGIGLPKLDQDIGDRTAALIHHSAVDDDPLADRLTTRRIVQDKIVIERAEFAVAEQRSRHFRQRVLQREQRLPGRAQHARLVLWRQRRRVNAAVALEKLALPIHDAR